MPDMNLPLLSDDDVLSFIVRGYHLVQPELPDGFNASIVEQVAALDGPKGNAILQALPDLMKVYEHPQVRGALTSLLGPDYRMHPHRHLHTTSPGHGPQGWHQDGTNVRHHQVWCVLAMYYPQDVALDMGPTMIMPGTHLRNAPTDRMATYGNLKGQVALDVRAGTIAITHYDLWHAASRNRSDRPRHMFKFLFDRQSAPTSPTWDHDPATASQTARGRVSEMLGAAVYNSDYYKEWELRTEMWRWMLGGEHDVAAGAFKDMLG